MANKDDVKFENDYDILQVLQCHEKDVRCVRPYPNAGVVTGSYDTMTKLYQSPNPTDRHCELTELQNFVGPTDHVLTVCCGKNKAGEYEIYAGSLDMNIYVYNLVESKPIATLTQHNGPVDALAFRVCDDQDVLASASWDSTVVVWKDKTASLTLAGHDTSVTCVAFVARTHILSGGARDKTIRRWDIKDGSLVTVYEGHEDCVRGIAVINVQQFLSCSNDEKVILWNINGDVLKIFEGHTSFIYDICIVREPIKPGAEPPKNRPFKFITCSEDKTVRVWDKDRGCLQKIDLEASTLWSVAGLDNGNFVVGTSIGIAYVFSNVPSKSDACGPGPST